MAYDTTKLYYSPTQTRVGVTKTADDAFELNPTQRAGLSSDQLSGIGSTGSLSYSLPNYTAPKTGSALVGSTPNTNSATNSPYQPSAGTGNTAGYSSAQTDPNYITGQQQLYAPKAGQLPLTPPPTGYANGLQPDDPSNKFNTATGQLNQKYKQGLAQTNASGTPVPPTQGGANSVVKNSLTPSTPQISPEVQNFTQANEYFQQSIKDVMEILNPETTRTEIADQFKVISGEQAEAGQLKTELMNIKRVMAGSEQDIRDEIIKSGGSGTDSQIRQLAVSRNSALLKQASQLTDQLSIVQDSINNDVSLLGDMKQEANNMFSKGMQLLNYQQENQQNARNAAKDSITSLLKTPGGLSAMASNPDQASYADKIMGWAPGTALSLANEQSMKQDLIEVSPGASLYDPNTNKGIYTAPQKATSTGGGGSGGGASTTTQAIINNPSLFDDLTPTVKGQVISQLQAQGYDTANLGLKGLSDSAIQSISQTQKAIDDLNYLKTKIKDNEDKLGPITGLAALNPWSESRKLQADVDRVRQTVGKALEGGVLRKEDEEKYKKILATLTDTPSTANYKIDALISSITRDIGNYKSLQQSSGKSLNVGASLQKTGSTTKTEDLRTKYNY